ncbi:hypothetical protein [Streptomyces sp. NPDC048332]|uniref:hypothetical protein n=1 Tax=Streptomyces sp. NPDC048332 TaxID=3154619 RepID=UPI0034173C77
MSGADIELLAVREARRPRRAAELGTAELRPRSTTRRTVLAGRCSFRPAKAAAAEISPTG